MALRLGELVAILKTDDRPFKRGLDTSERDFRKHSVKLRAEADRSAFAVARSWVTRLAGVGGHAGKSGIMAAGAFLGGLGTKVGGILPGVIGNAFSAMPPQIQGVVVLAAVAVGTVFAAAAGAAIAAGILLAVGGGVLAAGIMAAVRDPAVGAAWSAFGERAKTALAGFAEPFKAPLIRAASTFGDALERMAPTLKEMGASMAPVIDKLAPALASMAEKALPGIRNAMEASKPLFDKLAEHAPKIGEAISKFFDKIAAAGPGATLFFEDLLGWIEWLLETLGNVVWALSKIYEGVHAAWSGIKEAFATGVRVILDTIGTIVHGAAKAFSWIPGLGPQMQGAAAEFEKFRNRANAALASITDKTINVDINLRGIQNLDERAAARLGRRAAGGPVTAGMPYLVGEQGPELVVPRSVGTVIPAGRTAALMSGRAGGVGGGVAEVRLTGELVARGSDLVLVLREMVQLKGGGNVQAAFGQD